MRSLDELATFPGGAGASHQVGSVLWSPESGSFDVVTTDRSTLTHWSLAESDLSKPRSSQSVTAGGVITAACWDPLTVTRVLSSSRGGIHSWDTRELGSGSGAPTTEVARAHEGAVLSLDCNPNRPQQVMSTGADQLIKMWDLRKTAAPVLTLPGHSHWAAAARYNPTYDQLVLSGSSDHTVRLWGASSVSSEPFGSASSEGEEQGPAEIEQNDGPLVRASLFSRLPCCVPCVLAWRRGDH